MEETLPLISMSTVTTLDASSLTSAQNIPIPVPGSSVPNELIRGGFKS